MLEENALDHRSTLARRLPPRPRLHRRVFKNQIGEGLERFERRMVIEPEEVMTVNRFEEFRNVEKALLIVRKDRQGRPRTALPDQLR